MQTKTVITVAVSVIATAVVGAAILGGYVLANRYNEAIRSRMEAMDALKKAAKSCQDNDSTLLIALQSDNLTAQCAKLTQATSTKR